MSSIVPVVVKKYKITKDNGTKISVNVIRDDLLEGGTKQRGLYEMLEKSDANTFVYGSPLNGYAMVALSYCASLLDKKAVIFVAGSIDSASTKKAKKYGATVNFVNGTLEKAQDAATKYAESHKNTMSVPFGVHSADFIKILYKNLKKATKHIAEPFRIWIPIGSGTLARVLMKLWPNAKIMPIRIGKNIWEDQFTAEEWERLGGRKRIDGLRVINDPKLPKIKGFKYQRFEEPAPILPPWPSMKTYDAKVYQRILQFGQDGDYVWNVAP
jgi:hypothetical protein